VEVMDNMNAKDILQNEILLENKRILRYISALFFFGLTGALVCAIITGDTANYICYLALNIVLVLLTMLAVDFKLNIVDAYGDNAILLIESLIYLSGVVGGTIMCDHQSEIVTFAVLIVFVPGLFYERKRRKFLLSLTALVAFVILDYISKEYPVFICEVPNIVVLWIIGIVSSTALFKTRLGNLRGKIIEADYNEHLQAENKTLTARYMYSVEELLKDRDENTGEHVKRTRDIVAILVKEIKKDNTIGVSEETLDNIVKAAPLHDIGKMSIEDGILKKNGQLSLEEYRSIKEHSEKGAYIIRRLFREFSDRNLAKVAENIAFYHHERYDGTGYPLGLSANQIPIEARIISMADVYDALVSKRCYKEKISFDEAFEMIESGMGSQFDPNLNKYFVAGRAEIESYYL